MSEAVKMTEVRTVFVFGDSHVAGHGAGGYGWAQRLGEVFHEYNHAAPSGRTLVPAFYPLGVPLNRARYIAERVDTDAKSRLIGRVLGRVGAVVSAGFCDSIQTRDGRPYFDVETFASDVGVLVEQVQALGTQRRPARLMYVGLTPCSPEVAKGFRDQDYAYTNARLRLFEEKACNVVRRMGGIAVPLMDQLLEEHFHELHMSDDGIHPNVVGHQRVAEIVRPHFVDMIAES